MYSLTERDGAKTTVTVAAEPGTKLEHLQVIGQGTARCKPDDLYNPKTGELIALGRALKDYGAKVEEAGLCRSLSLDEVDAVLAELFDR